MDLDWLVQTSVLGFVRIGTVGSGAACEDALGSCCGRKEIWKKC